MHRNLLILLMLMLLVSSAFSESYTSTIDSAVTRFSTSDHRSLKLAMQELAALPEDANKELVAKFKNATIYEKIILIEVFALRKQESACSDIVEVIEFLPESAAPRIAAALDNIGDKGWQMLVKQIEAKNKQGTARTPKLEKVYQLLVRERILNFYIEQVDSRRFAYFRDDYAEIFKFGQIALDVLKDLIFNKDNILGNFPPDKTDKIREYIVRSLGDSGLPECKAIIEKAQSEFQGYNSYRWYYDETASELDFSAICSLALYNLGDTKKAELLFSNADETLKKMSSLVYFDQMFYKANMFMIVHKLDEAEEVFNKAIETIDEKEDNSAFKRKKAYAWYKLATIAGIRAQAEKDEEAKGTLRRQCLQKLKAAYRAGFNDFSRIFLDKNIQILWETGEFKKWIEKLRKDEELKELIPTWEPGKPTEITREEREKTPDEESFDPFPE